MKQRFVRISKYTSFIPFILISALTFLIYEQTYAPNGIIFSGNNFLGFVFLVVANLTLIISTIYVQRFDVKQTKIRMFLIYALLIILALGVLNLIIMPMDQTINVTKNSGVIVQMILNVSQGDKFRSLMLLFTSVSFVYLMAVILPRKESFRGFVLLISYSIIIYGLGIAIYSFITEFGTYIDLIKIGYANANLPVPTGPYDNRNTFASFLLTAIMFSTFLYFFYKTRKRRYIYIVLTVPMLVAIYFTFSKTNMILAFVVFILVFLRHLFLLLKRQKKAFFIELSIFLVLIALFFSFRFAPFLSTTRIARALTNLFPLNLVDIGESTMKARFELWRLAYDLIISRPRTFIFGDGIFINRIFYNQRIVLENPGWSTTGYGNYHNGFIEIFHAFGLIGFTIYIAILLGFLVKIIGFMKKMPAPGYFLFLSLIVFLSRSNVESIMLLAFKTESILASFALLLPYFYFSSLRQEKKSRTAELIRNVSR